MSIIKGPESYSPVNAPMWIGYSSTDYTKPDYKYLFHVDATNLETDTITSLGDFKIPPRPNDGYGLFTPHKLIRTQLSYDIQPFISNATNALKSVVRWSTTHGWQYNPNMFFNGPNLQVVSAHAYSSIIGDYSSAGKYNVGDIIQIEVTGTLAWQNYYNGYHTVVAVYDNYPDVGQATIAFDKDWSQALRDDLLSYPYGTLTLLRHYEGDGPGGIAFNGTRQYSENDYLFTWHRAFTHESTIPTVNYPNQADKTCLPLTDYPKYGLSNTGENTIHVSKTVYRYNYETLSFLFDYDGDNDLPGYWYWQVRLYNASGTQIATNNENLDISKYRLDMPVGPMNLEGTWFTKAQLDATSYYKFQLYRANPSVGSTLHAENLYKITDDCSPYREKFRVAFQNRHGGIDYFNFNRKNSNTVNVSRTEWRKVLPYNYSTGDRQDTILAQKAQETWTISTDWITEQESNWLKELITSPEVYIVDETGQNLLPIIVLNTDYTTKTAIDDKLFSFSIQFRYAWDINLQQS